MRALSEDQLSACRDKSPAQTERGLHSWSADAAPDLKAARQPAYSLDWWAHPITLHPEPSSPGVLDLCRATQQRWRTWWERLCRAAGHPSGWSV